MDFLQVALIFLILLLSIFLAITGIQVFFILRDLQKALDKLNQVLKTGEEIAQDLEKPVGAAANLVGTLKKMVKRESKVKQKRFYKKIL